MRERTVGGPSCIYCVVHNTQCTFLALIDSTGGRRWGRQVGAQARGTGYITLARLNSPHGDTRPANVSFQLQPHTLYHASLLVYRNLFSTYCKAPPTST